MKSILVTGGAGFIGSHLCERLLLENNRVICVDNFLTGKKENIIGFLNNPNFKLIEKDIVEPISVEEKIDEIYNLACPASPIHYQKDPVQTMKINTIGMINVLNLAKEKGAKILQASTSEVYGDPEVHPQTEEYRGNVNPDGPRACYDEGKRCAETLCFDYLRTYNLKIKIVRIFNTYGPNMAVDDGRVVSNFILQALENEDITVYGDGLQTRSFCYVGELVDGLMKMMNTEDSVTGPINLGNPVEFTVLELAEKVIQLTGAESKIIHQVLPVDDPRQRKPDITKAKNILNWDPKINLEEGLLKTIEYFKAKV
jgi:UDP-glucuronate decarboxylase